MENTIPALHKERWVLAYVPILDNYENLLCKEIIPIANEVLKQKRASDFIFRREGENKLALYFHTSPYNSERYIKPTLFEKLGKNKIEYKDYCILYHGSGNEADLAEMLLPFTSRIVSTLMGEKGKEWSTEASIEYALPMQIALVHSFGLSRNDISVFYSYLVREGLANLNLDGVPRPDEWRSGFVEMLESNFQTQSEALVGYADYLMNSLSNKEEFEEEWMNEWRIKCEAVSGIFDLQTDEQRRLPEDFKVNPALGVSEHIQKKWPMLHELTMFINSQMGMELFFQFNVFHIISRCAEILEETNAVAE